MNTAAQQTDSEPRWVRILHSVLDFPDDLLFVLGYVTFAAVVFQALSTPFHALVGLPFVLFLPGYALLSVLFPRRGTAVTSRRDRRLGRHLSWGYRVALSFGISVAMLPVLGAGLALSGLGFAPEMIIRSLAVVIVGGGLLGGVRRLALPENERFRVPVDRWVEELRSALSGTGSMVDTLLTVGLLLSVVVAMSTLAYAVVVPSTGEAYTGFSVLTEDASGDLVATGYPTEFVRGESQPVVLSVENHEGMAMTYEVVVELQRVDGESGTVLERMEVDRFSTTVADGDTWHEPVAISPQVVGEDLRLVFYLYADEAPADPSTETATEYLHLWIDVTADT